MFKNLQFYIDFRNFYKILDFSQNSRKIFILVKIIGKSQFDYNILGKF